MKYLAGMGIAAAILSSAAAHAQLVVAKPDVSQTSYGPLYFNVTTPNVAPTTSDPGTLGELTFLGPNIGINYTHQGSGTPYTDLGSVITSTELLVTAYPLFSNVDMSGQTVDAATLNAVTTGGGTGFIPGTETYGFSLLENDGEHYGYITLTQTGSYNGNTGADYGLTDTIDTLAFDEKANQGVLIPADADAVPEPNSLSLLGVAGAGLAGLALNRRKRKA